MTHGQSPPFVNRLRSQTHELASAIVDRHYVADPQWQNRFGADGRQRCLEDTQYHLRYLAEAVEAESPILFMDYVAWVDTLLQGRNLTSDDLHASLSWIRDALAEHFLPDEQSRLFNVLDAGMATLAGRAPKDANASAAGPHHELASRYMESLLRGNRHDAVRMVHDAVAGGLTIKRLYLDVLQPVQYEIGWLWQQNRISVAQEHYATAVTQLVMSQLYEQVLGGPKNGRVVVCACIGGDLHEIGSRMVADFFELEGWDSYFFGASVPLTGIVQQANDRKADLLAISATMTYHLPQVRETIAAVRRECTAAILVGGRPFKLDPTLWHRVGADGCARDAESAVRVAANLLDRGSPQ